MSAPWHQTTGFWKRSLSSPYNRMMNTSGMSFRDHAGSMVSILYCLPSVQNDLTYLRTFAVLLCSSATKSSNPVDISSASFTREQRTKTWRSN
ncbi:hypothetical protein BJX61DRAFT_525052 [Aspergillus egyptiacus]|nr:hypothetical protein BJX61DRAFT_525052 [Aspergillus egyptiacus]